METTIIQQILETLQKSTRVLIVLPHVLSADAVASGVALKLFLQKLGKEADVASAEAVPDRLRFLPSANLVQTTLQNGKNFVIEVNTAVKELEEISYQTQAEKVSIYLKPKDGQFIPEDVTFTSEKQPYDALVALECRNLEELGRLFEEYPDLVYETPKINIDNHPENEYFGAINLVDINASSVAEILALVFEKYEQQVVDEDIATALLTGIIAKTNSFQHSHTTPRAFLKASELIALGGRQQEVVKHLFKTKPLPLLRIWGRALARLKMHDELPVIYSLLNLSDFGKAGASIEDLTAVLKELLDSISGYKVAALVSEAMGGNVRLLIATHPQVRTESFIELAAEDAPPHPITVGAYSILDIEIKGKSLTDAENIFLEAVAKAVVVVSPAG